MNKKLSDVLNFLDSIEAINSGGCGVSALAIYRWCKKHRVKVDASPFVILTTYGDEWDIRHNSEIIQNGEHLDKLEITHLVIEVGTKLTDSTGEPDLEYYCYRQPEQLNESQLLEALDCEWNRQFDRRENIPLIEQALGIDLSDVSLRYY